MCRRKVMFPRKEAWSTLWKSARFDPPTGVDAFRLHGSSASVSSHFEMPQYRAHAIRYRRKLATHPCPFNGDGSFIDRSRRVRCTLHLRNLQRCRSLRHRPVK